MSFLMYHATPASRITSIQWYGLTLRPSPHGTLWAPKQSVIYLTSSIDIARDYARQAYAMGKTFARAFGIFKVAYDEFPNEVYQDLEWGLPGTYFVMVPIPPKHVELVEVYKLTTAPKRYRKV